MKKIESHHVLECLRSYDLDGEANLVSELLADRMERTKWQIWQTHVIYDLTDQ